MQKVLWWPVIRETTLFHEVPDAVPIDDNPLPVLFIGPCKCGQVVNIGFTTKSLTHFVTNK